MPSPLPSQPYRPGRGDPRPQGLDEGPPHVRFDRGVALYAAGYWWEAHEVWESLWVGQPRGSPEASLLQGLILLAAAQLKAWCDQPRGSRTLAGRALTRLVAARDALRQGEATHGLDLRALCAAVDAWRAAPPPAPRHEAVLAAAPRLVFRPAGSRDPADVG